MIERCTPSEVLVTASGARLQPSLALSRMREDSRPEWYFEVQMRRIGDPVSSYRDMRYGYARAASASDLALRLRRRYGGAACVWSEDSAWRRRVEHRDAGFVPYAQEIAS